MAERVYELNMDKNCPRCGSNKVIVEVFHFGNTYKPMCGGCGLKPDESCSTELTVRPTMTNLYFNYKYFSY